MQALGRMLQRGLAAKMAPSAKLIQRCPTLMAPSRLMSSRAAATPVAAEAVDLEDENEWIASQSVSVQRRVLKLKEVQNDYDAINRDFQKELAVLQAKYLEKYQPLFDARREVVSGKTAVDKYDLPDDKEDEDEGIANFWLTAFYNHEKIGPYITEADAAVLESLTDIRSAVLTGEERGFEITFSFAPNKFFTNTTLTKRYILEPEDDVIPKEFIGCEIKWKDEKLNPTVELTKKRVKSKDGAKGGKPAFVMEAKPCESFFNIFEPPKIPTEPELLGDDELDALQEELTADFDIGFAIKDQVIPRAVEWFTGELSQFDEGDYGDEFDENEFEEEMDEPPTPPPKQSRR